MHALLNELIISSCGSMWFENQAHDDDHQTNAIEAYLNLRAVASLFHLQQGYFDRGTRHLRRIEIELDGYDASRRSNQEIMISHER
jgi:hypothetical protein